MEAELHLAAIPRVRYSAPTHLPQANSSRLVCLCLTNVRQDAFAPAFLFLAGEQAQKPPDEALSAIIAVKNELQW